MRIEQTRSRPLTRRVIIAALLVGCGVVFSLQVEHDTLASESGANLQKLRLSRPSWPKKQLVDAILFEGVVYRQAPRGNVQFDGVEYEIGAAIPILMDAVLTEKRPLQDRIHASQSLLHASAELVDSQWIPELIAYLEKCDNRDLKVAIIKTVAGSQDQRGLPLLSSILRKEDDPILQFSVAGPLAAWNIRDGVQALVKLLDSDLMVSQNQHLWWAVLRGLEELNAYNDWGFPMDETKENISQIADRDKRWVAYRHRWRDWFAENMHRFPDWQPGDPLPEHPQSERDASENREP